MGEATSIVERCRRPLSTANDFGPLLRRIGNARYLLLGEASHGTSEFYLSRARLRQRLIIEKGFNFVAVEGDWPDCYRLNRYVKGYPGSAKNAVEALNTLERWPTWMWANWASRNQRFQGAWLGANARHLQQHWTELLDSSL
jgi:erythromycin esterase-like protein